MKMIGLIGGLSWESSIEYYRLVNEMVKARLGGLHSAQCLLYSFDFAEIEHLQKQGDWDSATRRMIEAGQALERAGSACLVICSNTMHKMAAEVQAAVNIPLLHIAEATGQAIQAQGLTCVGLLGTIYTMNQNFYAEYLQQQYGLDVIVPEMDARHIINQIIYEELVLGIVKPESRAAYVQIIKQLGDTGAQGVILGCTEIGLLIKAEDSPLPVFDTTWLHAQAAVDFALT